MEKLLTLFNLSGEIKRIKREEDESFYDVYSVKADKKEYIIKKAKEYEAEIYSVFFKDEESSVPKIIDIKEYKNEKYILMEKVVGESLIKCKRYLLKNTLDALIKIQNKYWENQEYKAAAYNFKISLESRINRGKYLKDTLLEEYYGKFLHIYKTVERTLCNDDLLPFNVIANEKEAFIIDWEFGGILPYLSSFSRFIAHGEEDETAFFYMKNEDKLFAIEYYYENLVKEKGIEYEKYRKDISYFLLYEYCEWIMLSNKYEDADRERFEKYKEMAFSIIKEIKLVDKLN